MERNAGTKAEVPRDPEKDLIIRLNDSHYRIWKLSGDYIHGDENAKQPLVEEKIRESTAVLETINQRSALKRIGLEIDDENVTLSWDPLRSDDSTRVFRKYSISDLERIDPNVRVALGLNPGPSQ